MQSPAPGRRAPVALRLPPARAVARPLVFVARVLLVAVPAIALCSCMIGPDFATPPTRLAADWSDAGDPTAVDPSHEEHREWWAVFGDPALTKLVEAAYAENPSLQAAGARVLAARAQLGVAIGELYPQQQQLTASASWNRIPVSIPYDLLKNKYWQSLVGAQAAWEIDLWGKIRRGIQSADYSFLETVAAYDDALVTLVGDVASTYVQIRTLEKRIAIALQNVDRQRIAVQIATNRFEAGVVSKRDVYQAENVLAQTEAAIPALAIELRQAENALSVLLGRPPGPIEELRAAGSNGVIPAAPDRAAVGIPADLLRRRPDVREAELAAAAQSAQIGVAKADLLPAFTLLGNVGTVSSDIGRGSLSDLFTSKSLAYSVGPAVEWNILNYGQITNTVRVQDARFQELLLAYQNTVLAAQEEVANGIAIFVQSRKQVVFLEASVAAAEGALQIAMNEYIDGTADFTTVLTAEQNLYTAQDDLAVAMGNIPLGLIATYRALGGGWQIREGQGFVSRDVRDEMAERTSWGTLLTPELLEPEAPGLPGPADADSTVRPPEW